jgi:glucose-6-phosphate 1-dehydrogenase
MHGPVSDAIVFFGATGDLAYEQIFPALQGLVRDEGLDVPIIGVAKAGWSLGPDGPWHNPKPAALRP